MPGKDVKSDGTVGSWSGAGSKLRAPPRKPATMLNPQMLKAQAAALRAQQAKLARDREQASARTLTGPTKTTGDVAPSANPPVGGGSRAQPRACCRRVGYA